jgi:hypothetical protein
VVFCWEEEEGGCVVVTVVESSRVAVDEVDKPATTTALRFLGGFATIGDDDGRSDVAPSR